MTLPSDDAAPPPAATAAPADETGRRSLVAVGGFFALKAAIGVLILAASAKRLPVAEFAGFSQLFLYLALLGSVASGGVQNGVVREVAAANGDGRRERIVVLGGVLVWAGVSLLITLAALVWRDRIAVVLTGGDGVGAAVAALTVVALVTGLGTLLCSALSGAGRAPLSLGIQGLGLLVGGALCLERLWAGDGLGAVLFYALGPLVAVAAALWTSRRWFRRSSEGTGEEGGGEEGGEVRWPDVRRSAVDLLRYSATFLVVVSVLPLVLFAVRYVYRLEFGAELLGYWLLANRASDVTTQIVGLYLSQVYLPQATRSRSEAERRALIRRTLGLGMGVAGAGAAVFAIASEPIFTWVLSDRYRPALPFVLGYLVGDMFRVGGNVALFTALAARRLMLFVSIEVALAALVGAVILAGIALGHPAAAYWGYLGAHAAALAVVLMTVRRLARLV